MSPAMVFTFALLSVVLAAHIGCALGAPPSITRRPALMVDSRWTTPPAQPIYNASAHMKPVSHTVNGSLFQVSPPGATPYKLVRVRGDAHARGYAYGYLLAADVSLMLTQMDVFYASEVNQIPWSKLGLPKWLVELLESALKHEAPAVFKKALGWVLSQQLSHLQASRVAPLDEMRGMAEGMCASPEAPSACNVDTLENELRLVNMLPELIKMTCSMVGAWGSATAPDAGLLQLRTLDFGTGPFANRTVVAVHHPTEAGATPFAAISFMAFVGAVTGFSPHIALSEKVWETYRKESVQPGTYKGSPVVLIIREMLQFGTSRTAAIDIARRADRTWSVFLGVGGAADGTFSALGYRSTELRVFDPRNMSSVTNAPDPAAAPAGKGGNAPPMTDLVYIDKHPQPSASPLLPDLLVNYTGRLSGPIFAQEIPRLTQSGDVHVMAVDFSNKLVYISIGAVDANGSYGADNSGMACFQPITVWDNSIWDE
eukprot:UC1_evm1s2046